MNKLQLYTIAKTYLSPADMDLPRPARQRLCLDLVQAFDHVEAVELVLGVVVGCTGSLRAGGGLLPFERTLQLRHYRIYNTHSASQ